MPGNFDRVLGLDPVELFAFVSSTQPKAWEQLIARGYGNDAAAAQLGFAKRLASEIDARRTVDVLRHGVEGLMVEPAHVADLSAAMG